MGESFTDHGAAHAGLAWPNPGCPVMMVECENGIEERSATGSLVTTRGKAAAANDTAAANAGSSYFNKQEAILAVRCALFLLSASSFSWINTTNCVSVSFLHC